MARWIPAGVHDVYVVALQEIKMRSGDEWTRALEQHLGCHARRSADRYKAVGVQTMWGIHVVVICRLALVGRLSNIQTDLCKQGKSKNVGLGGNKGAVACSFTVDGATRVCFVNTHLVARCERLHKPVCFALRFFRGTYDFF